MKAESLKRVGSASPDALRCNRSYVLRIFFLSSESQFFFCRNGFDAHRPFAHHFCLLDAILHVGAHFRSPSLHYAPLAFILQLGAYQSCLPYRRHAQPVLAPIFIFTSHPRTHHSPTSHVLYACNYSALVRSPFPWCHPLLHLCNRPTPLLNDHCRSAAMSQAPR